MSVQRRPEPKPLPVKSRIVVPPLPLGSETSASPKDAQLKRLCEAFSEKRTIKGRPAKDTRKTRYQGQPEKTPGPAKDTRQMRRQRPARETAPAPPAHETHSTKPARIGAPERRPCKPSCGPKIAGKFGVPQQNRYLRTYRTTPAVGQYSRPSDRLPGKSTA